MLNILSAKFFLFFFSRVKLLPQPGKFLATRLLSTSLADCFRLISIFVCIVGSMEASSKAFLLFFLLPDWLKLNHLRSRMECGFSDIFSRHICSTVAETIGVTNYAASFGAKNVQKTTFEAAEMMLGPWN